MTANDQTPEVSPEGAPEETPEAPTFDAAKVAVRAIRKHVGKDEVPAAKLELATARHTAQVKAAGKAVPLDWTTRQFLSPARIR